MNVAIIDYGMGNLHSVLKSAQTVNDSGASLFLSHHPDDIAKADKVIFPGQGAMPDCVDELARRELTDVIRYCAQSKPFFGICIGAQLLFEHSEEGQTNGLGILPGQVKRFPTQDAQTGEKRRVPHMGWNMVHQLCHHPLFAQIAQDDYFYFAHSYYFQPQDSSLTLAKTDYPSPFSCVIGHENVFATQFHPEKSHQPGLQMMKNFLAWDGSV